MEGTFLREYRKAHYLFEIESNILLAFLSWLVIFAGARVDK
jgi:hypothetical protein